MIFLIRKKERGTIMHNFKIGVLGVADHFIKRVLLPLKQSEIIDVYAIASRSAEKAKKAGEQWDIPVTYGSYEELLKDGEVDAVYIPLPNHVHVEWIKKCADAGKHIICEKPLTLNALEAKEAADYVKVKGVHIMEAFMYRFHPKWKRVKELVSHGEIGEVQAIHTLFSYNNQDPKNIRNIKEYGGGTLMDIGCYAISTARYIMGDEPKRVVGLNTYDENFGTDILSSGMMDFGTARCMFTCGTQIYAQQEVKILGTGGAITVTIPFNDCPDIPGKIIVATDVAVRTVEFDPVEQYRLEFEEFARSVHQNKLVPTPIEDAVSNMKVIDALFQSADEGKWIEIR